MPILWSEFGRLELEQCLVTARVKRVARHLLLEVIFNFHMYPNSHLEARDFVKKIPSKDSQTDIACQLYFLVARSPKYLSCYTLCHFLSLLSVLQPSYENWNS